MKYFLLLLLFSGAVFADEKYSNAECAAYLSYVGINTSGFAGEEIRKDALWYANRANKFDIALAEHDVFKQSDQSLTNLKPWQRLVKKARECSEAIDPQSDVGEED